MTTITEAVEKALAQLADSNSEARGAIFTRPEVVDLILDLVGYTADKHLFSMRLLEPSFGEGHFLLGAVRRLLASYSSVELPQRDVVGDLRDCIRAVELHRDTFDHTRLKLLALLNEAGFEPQQCESLANAWLLQADFLLASLPFKFSHIVGNPPYVRQEMIDDALLAEYRRRFTTMSDRADLYVPFYEKSLLHLEKGGLLGFICSDRWMKNKYGGPLRRLVAERFHLKFYIDMVNTQAFHTDVLAYPAITVIVNEPKAPTRIVHQPTIEADQLLDMATRLLDNAPAPEVGCIEVQNVARGDEPWILGSFDQLAVVRRLESTFPALEEAGCNVGIGVATGADKVFIGKFDALDVEPARKLRLVMTRDIQSGTLSWRGYGIINPFEIDGRLADLAHYPRLATYLEAHSEAIRKRRIAKDNPKNWYRTIDHIWPELVDRPKLLIPDIKGKANIVLDEGGYCPHHNLYYITSDEWDLRALRVVLLSGMAMLFVSVYSTKIRGGYLRFQAQYLRRIRIPRWRDVPDDLKAELICVAGHENVEARNEAVFRLYGLSAEERVAIGGSEE